MLFNVHVVTVGLQSCSKFEVFTCNLYSLPTRSTNMLAISLVASARAILYSARLKKWPNS